jgi:hypothetical protein
MTKAEFITEIMTHLEFAMGKARTAEDRAFLRHTEA